MHLAELLIVCAGGLLPGLLLAWAAVPALLAMNPVVARTLGAVRIDWRVQLFSLVLALLAAVAASLVPALRALRGPVATLIAGGGGRTTSSPKAVRLQRGLVSLEVALCVALLMAGATVIQGLRELSRLSPGYEAAGVLTAQVGCPNPPTRRPRLGGGGRAPAGPDPRAAGVTAASTTQNTFVPGFSYQTLVSVKDRPTPDGQRTRCSSAASAPITSRPCGSAS